MRRRRRRSRSARASDSLRAWSASPPPRRLCLPPLPWTRSSRPWRHRRCRRAAGRAGAPSTRTRARRRGRRRPRRRRRRRRRRPFRWRREGEGRGRRRPSLRRTRRGLLRRSSRPWPPLRSGGPFREVWRALGGAGTRESSGGKKKKCEVRRERGFRVGEKKKRDSLFFSPPRHAMNAFPRTNKNHVRTKSREARGRCFEVGVESGHKKYRKKNQSKKKKKLGSPLHKSRSLGDLRVRLSSLRSAPGFFVCLISAPALGFFILSEPVAGERREWTLSSRSLRWRLQELSSSSSAKMQRSTIGSAGEAAAAATGPAGGAAHRPLRFEATRTTQRRAFA